MDNAAFVHRTIILDESTVVLGDGFGFFVFSFFCDFVAVMQRAMEANARYKRWQRVELMTKQQQRPSAHANVQALGFLGEKRRRRRGGSERPLLLTTRRSKGNVTCSAGATNGNAIVCGSGGNKTAIVVGAGVIGLCTSVRLLENGYQVKCIAENVLGDPNDGVVSGGAGGLWFPYLCESTERTGRWANETRKVYEEMLLENSGSNNNNKNGVAVRECWQCYSSPASLEIPPWAPDCPTFEIMTAGQVAKKYLPRKPQFTLSEDDYLAYSFEAPIVQVDLFLKHLRDEIVRMGGKLVQERVNSSIDMLEADVVVNCAGLGNAVSQSGLEQDGQMMPVRGQIIHCKNNRNITQAVTLSMGGESAYVIPRGDLVVYGGTSDENQWDLTVEEDVSKKKGNGPSHHQHPIGRPRPRHINHLSRVSAVVKSFLSILTILF